jgi:hypothetical protein
LVKIRSVWTGEEVPQESSAPQIQVNSPAQTGAAPSQVLVAPARVYNAPKKSKAGTAAGMVFFGVLVLGVGIWLGTAKPWAAAEVVGEGPKLVVLEPRSGGIAAAKPLEKVAPKPAAKGEGNGKAVAKKSNGKNGKKETAQERIDRVARETTEKMGFEQNDKGELVMPDKFGPEDGGAMRIWEGEQGVLEGVLFRVRDTRTGRSRYLEFSDEVGQDVVCARCWLKENELSLEELEGLKNLVGKKLRFRGAIQLETTRRVMLHISSRDQIEVVE